MLEEIWYERDWRRFLLAPLSLVFGLLTWCRRGAYRAHWLRSSWLSVPVIVVGNLTVGGTGKTTLVIWLAAYLRRRGYRPGLVLRGYGGRAEQWPQQVRPDSDPLMVGDEAVLLARRTGLPVAAGPDRVAAARALVEFNACDIVISDDGLQHYALARDIELAVVDGDRRFGNGWLLPAGPLREPMSRLNGVDAVVASGTAGRGEFPMRRVRPRLVALNGETGSVDLDCFHVRDVHAVAGVGNNERFFADLERLGFEITPHAFPDHHDFSVEDLQFKQEKPIIMTEKDAVKCWRFAPANSWFLRVDADLPEVFAKRIDSLLERARSG